MLELSRGRWARAMGREHASEACGRRLAPPPIHDHPAYTRPIPGGYSL
jgi:hypothetical protein